MIAFNTNDGRYNADELEQNARLFAVKRQLSNSLKGHLILIGVLSTAVFLRSSCEYSAQSEPSHPSSPPPSAKREIFSGSLESHSFPPRAAGRRVDDMGE